MEYDKETAQDISSPERHPFRLTIIGLGSTRIKGIFPATSNQATDRHHPSAEVSAENHTVQKLSLQEITYSFHGKEEGDLLSICDHSSY